MLETRARALQSQSLTTLLKLPFGNQFFFLTIIHPAYGLIDTFHECILLCRGRELVSLLHIIPAAPHERNFNFLFHHYPPWPGNQCRVQDLMCASTGNDFPPLQQLSMHSFYIRVGGVNRKLALPITYTHFVVMVTPTQLLHKTRWEISQALSLQSFFTSCIVLQGHRLTKEVSKSLCSGTTSYHAFPLWGCTRAVPLTFVT